MSLSPFFPAAAQLPDSLPIFPLENALVLPRAELPLNIFEPRYLNMVNDALATHHLIGMVQPKLQRGIGQPDLYNTGCAGRITYYRETADGRIEIRLTGVCRFDITQEMPSIRGYRIVEPNWQRFLADLDDAEETSAAQRETLVGLTKRYLEAKNLTTDWRLLERLSTLQLVHTLSIYMPFAPLEKQAILEAQTLPERCMALRSAMQFEIEGAGDSRPH